MSDSAGPMSAGPDSTGPVSARPGGVAALIAAATVVVGLGMFAFVLSDYTTGDPEPAESVAFLADNYAAIYLWTLITLVVFSIALVVLALVLHRMLTPSPSLLAPTATAFALIWAGLLIAAGMVTAIGIGVVLDIDDTNPLQAESLWLAVDTIGNGLSGGLEIVGPLWVLLVSLAALQARVLPNVLNYLGIGIAASGLITIIPVAEEVGAIFGLGLVVWLAWLGVVLLRESPSTAA